MGWVTLTLRKQTLKADINETQFQDIQLSRELRAVSRNLSYEKSVFNTKKSSEVESAKETLNKIRDQRPSIESDEYKEWRQEYSDAREEYLAKKQDIEDYYDTVLEDLENDATDNENAKQDEQTQLEAQLEALQAELETVSEQIKSDIDADKISLS